MKQLRIKPSQIGKKLGVNTICTNKTSWTYSNSLLQCYQKPINLALKHFWFHVLSLVFLIIKTTYPMYQFNTSMPVSPVAMIFINTRPLHEICQSSNQHIHQYSPFYDDKNFLHLPRKVSYQGISNSFFHQQSVSRITSFIF